MAKANSLELHRLLKFVDSHRAAKAQLPTLADIEAAGFSKQLVQEAEKQKRLVKLYVTLTNGAIVKGYKRA